VITLTNGTAAVADLVTQLGRNDVVTVTIPVGAYVSPSSVATGGVAFKGTAPGSTTVTGSGGGSIITLTIEGQRTVTVTP
jgi:hypothetical protein